MMAHLMKVSSKRVILERRASSLSENAFKIPVIDLTSKGNKEVLSQEIVQAFEQTGMIYVENMPNLNLNQVYRCNKWFFKQPKNVKDGVLRYSWNKENINVYRGYFPAMQENELFCEGFEIGHDMPISTYSKNAKSLFFEQLVWPREDGEIEFKKEMRASYESFHKIALDILSLCALGLGLPENYFDYMFIDKPLSTLRLLHYPERGGNSVTNATVTKDGKIIAIGEHCDSEYLTLLTTFGHSGLEIQDSKGNWQAIPPRPQSLMVNIGDTFSFMMGGRFKAVRHRVIDLGVERYSAAFFLAPSYNTDIGFNIIKKAHGESTNHPEQPFGPFFFRKMKYEKKYPEFKDLPVE